ncbi:tRNA preQ1(34) S-adenosylmethionine ribosyltransferase-isomerase QueA [Temperatibacter marinus]|uniref:S-adenosylmethionine:tRNA ribosyltransferase-isomerase n=1 Tax=Temperatibacter marinus TaxID=1456591 RepID=A0AA52EGU3_9PROT|nr:tRNA preQ1(34) S-adenosylmethionine ribosyltransferase-isomerase QueA [Temperatibacter marinus]WND02262.1 tRNA preQ1(34) S-adenosylmethionine ribosyltransferase-isomerase QueA [Temperatibacter marinus]
MDIQLFDFELPNSAIALRPVSPRDHAKQLIIKPEASERLTTDRVGNLAEHIETGDLLVFNDTRVIPARLHGKRGEAKMEITLHKRESENSWWVFAKPAKKARLGDHLTFGTLTGEVMALGEAGERLVTFHVQEDKMTEALEVSGVMPLPPYIAAQRAVDERDKEDYQTLFAEKDGAVAAPTAGLHFTEDMMTALTEKGVKTAAVTLHVGAGTFLPVKVEDTTHHKMHSEYGEVTPEVAALINETKKNGKKVIAVGTTSLRVLESATDEDGVTHPFKADTEIFISPGYKFKCIDVLMTNFHLPKSTLFMLVSAFCGLELMQEAYQQAIDQQYRFYSYGDSSLLFRALGNGIGE